MMMERSKPQLKKEEEDGIKQDTSKSSSSSTTSFVDEKSKLTNLQQRLERLATPPPATATTNTTTDGPATASTTTKKKTITTQAETGGGAVASSGRNALLERVRAAQEKARLAHQKHREEQEQSLKLEREEKENERKKSSADALPPSYDELVNHQQEQNQQQQRYPNVIFDEKDEEALMEELERNDVKEDAVDEHAPSAPPLHLKKNSLDEEEQEDEEEDDFASLYQTTDLYENGGAATMVQQQHLKKSNNPYSLLDLPPSYHEFEEMQQQQQQQHQSVQPHHQEEKENMMTTSAPPFEYDAFGSIITSEEHTRVQEEQLRILEEIQRQRDEASMGMSTPSVVEQEGSGAHAAATSAASESATDHSQSATSQAVARVVSQISSTITAPFRSSQTQIVQVGPGHRVAVHDQTKTRDAIKAGTALLVECVSCQNWMQIASTASLMFCPCCQSVVPIIRQNAVKTKEEAMRLTRDRRMAEKMQNEVWGDTDGNNGTLTQEGTDGTGLTFGSMKEFVTSFFARTSTSNDAAIMAAGEGVGVAEDQPTELALAIPNVSNRLTGTGADDEERQGLVLPPARVAERKPYIFSCVMDSVSSVASSLGRTWQPSSEEGGAQDYEEVSFLAVTQARRGEDEDGGDGRTGTEYHRLLDHEHEPA